MENASAISSVATAMSTELQTQVADIVTGVGAIVPKVLPVVGVISMVYIGIRLFKLVRRG